MKNKRLALIATGILAALVLVAAGCEFTTIDTVNTSGRVINARVGGGSDPNTGVSNVTITLTPLDSGSAISATTSGTGNFSFQGINAGQYRLTGARSGWFIAPQTVTVGSAGTALPQVNAFELSSSDDLAISFIVAWTADMDVDAHLSFPTAAPAGLGEFAAGGTPYQGSLGETRQSVFWNNRNYPDGQPLDAVEMDRDDEHGPGVETITLRRTTHSAPSVTAVPGVPNGMDAIAQWGTNIQYRGAAILYVNAYYANEYLVNGTFNAGVIVYAIQTIVEGGTPTAQVLGVYRIPEETTIRSASVLRVNMFNDSFGDAFILVPDMGVIPEGPYGSQNGSFLSLDPMANVVGVRGR